MASPADWPTLWTAFAPVTALFAHLAPCLTQHHLPSLSLSLSKEAISHARAFKCTSVFSQIIVYVSVCMCVCVRGVLAFYVVAALAINS